MVQINKERLLNEFFDLVKIDSETGEERKICDYLINKLKSLQFEVTEDQSSEKTGHQAGNIIATLEGSLKETSMIYFTCHMDTVAPGKGIQPSIQDEYIVSDGKTILGSDDKAGIAALLEGIQFIQENNIPHGPLQLVITAGEESGLIGARNLDRELVQAEFGYALDSNGLVGEIIISAPSQVKILAKINGKAAHAGVNPEDGVSAIQVASRAISKMPLGRIDEETTANIGKFQGGTASNVVPDFVEILAEARSRDNKKLQQQVNKMVQAFHDAASELGAVAEVETTLLYPSFNYDENELVVQRAISAVKKIGRQPRLGPSGGGSDANIMAGYGIPTVNLGIGYENIHTTNEKMPIFELVKASEMVVAIIEECSKK